MMGVAIGWIKLSWDTCIQSNLTFDAPVCHRQVGLQILVARLHVHEILIQNSEAARVPPGAMAVHDVEHVVGTTDVSEDLTHTLAQIHSAVPRTLDHDHLVRGGAFGSVIFWLADWFFVDPWTNLLK